MATQNTLAEVISNFVGGAGLTVVGALAGRLMWHVGEVRKSRRRFLGWELAWELPVAFGMGLVGEGAASYFNLDHTASVGAIVCLAYLGPRGVEAVWAKWAAKKTS